MILPCLIKRKVSPLLLNKLKKNMFILLNEHIAFIARKFRKLCLRKRTMEKIIMTKILPKEMSHKIKVKVKLNLRKELSVLNVQDMIT